MCVLSCGLRVVDDKACSRFGHDTAVSMHVKTWIVAHRASAQRWRRRPCTDASPSTWWFSSTHICPTTTTRTGTALALSLLCLLLVRAGVVAPAIFLLQSSIPECAHACVLCAHATTECPPAKPFRICRTLPWACDTTWCALQVHTAGLVGVRNNAAGMRVQV